MHLAELGNSTDLHPSKGYCCCHCRCFDMNSRSAKICISRWWAGGDEACRTHVGRVLRLDVVSAGGWAHGVEACRTLVGRVLRLRPVLLRMRPPPTPSVELELAREKYRVGPEFTSWPSSLTANPYQFLRLAQSRVGGATRRHAARAWHRVGKSSPAH